MEYGKKKKERKYERAGRKMNIVKVVFEIEKKKCGNERDVIFFSFPNNQHFLKEGLSEPDAYV
jgi:hypothetical protein